VHGVYCSFSKVTKGLRLALTESTTHPPPISSHPPALGQRTLHGFRRPLPGGGIPFQTGGLERVCVRVFVCLFHECGGGGGVARLVGWQGPWKSWERTRKQTKNSTHQRAGRHHVHDGLDLGLHCPHRPAQQAQGGARGGRGHEEGSVFAPLNAQTIERV
jgi:hypothetical protein